MRTLKENLLRVRHFATVAELVGALRQFRRQYTERRLLERHGYRTPAQASAAWSVAVGALDRAPPGCMVGCVAAAAIRAAA